MYPKGVPPLALHNRLLPPPRGTPAQGITLGRGLFLAKGFRVRRGGGGFPSQNAMRLGVHWDVERLKPWH